MRTDRVDLTRQSRARLIRLGVLAARMVESAIHVRLTEEIDASQDQLATPNGPELLAMADRGAFPAVIAATSIGLAAVTRTVGDKIRPRRPHQS